MREPDVQLKRRSNEYKEGDWVLETSIPMRSCALMSGRSVVRFVSVVSSRTNTPCVTPNGYVYA
jgi:hypothetical protein